MAEIFASMGGLDTKASVAVIATSIDTLRNELRSALESKEEMLNKSDKIVKSLSELYNNNIFFYNVDWAQNEEQINIHFSSFIDGNQILMDLHKIDPKAKLAVGKKTSTGTDMIITILIQRR